MSTSDLIQTLTRIGRPRILVLGDLILDEYVWGGVERISPEAPIPVLRVQRRDHRPGGAGSVVANLVELGAEVHMLSAVGEDAGGEKLLSRLEAIGCNTDLVGRLPSRMTTVKTRHLGSVQHADRAVQQLLRVDAEETSPMGESFLAALGDKLERRILSAGGFDAVLVSDYDKGLLSTAFVQRVIRLAGGAPVLADPARLSSYERYRGCHLVCPNRYETSKATGMPCASVADCAAAGVALARTMGFRYVAVTMDKDGVCLCQPDGASRHFETEARVVADVTGAGDMVLSMMGLVLGGGGSVEAACALANVAAGIEIRLIGCTPVPRREVLLELSHRGFSGSPKLKLLGEILPKLRELQEQGRKVVFTNGCFDLLHPGHYYLLDHARRLGDCLVVAINSDASVRRLKGPERPLLRELDRMLMLSALECVDHVILFEEDTPTRLLEAIHPDILVKGSEYRDGAVVGRELVESYGGRVELVEQLPGFSTTSLFGRLRSDRGGSPRRE